MFKTKQYPHLIILKKVSEEKDLFLFFNYLKLFDYFELFCLKPKKQQLTPTYNSNIALYNVCEFLSPNNLILLLFSLRSDNSTSWAAVTSEHLNLTTPVEPLYFL